MKVINMDNMIQSILDQHLLEQSRTISMKISVPAITNNPLCIVIGNLFSVTKTQTVFSN